MKQVELLAYLEKVNSYRRILKLLTLLVTFFSLNSCNELLKESSRSNSSTSDFSFTSLQTDVIEMSWSAYQPNGSQFQFNPQHGNTTQSLQTQTSSSYFYKVVRALDPSQLETEIGRAHV